MIASIALPKIEADADAGAHGAESAADAEADGLAGFGGFFGGRQKGDESDVHGDWLLLVSLGDGAAEVDSGERGEDECLQRGDQADLEREQRRCRTGA